MKPNLRIVLMFVRKHIIALVSILICTTIYTWPLLSHLTTSIPGNSELPDVTENIWSVGWVQYALTHDANFFSADFLFVPFHIDTRLIIQGLLQALMAFPFTPLFGVVGAYNLIIIISFALNGVLAYGLIYSVTQDSQAALVSAACLMLSGALVWHFYLGRLTLPSLWIVIGVTWCLRSLLDYPTWHKGVLLGLLLLAASLTDFHILLFSVLWLAMSLGYQVFRCRSQFFEGRRISILGLTALVWVIPFLAYFLPAFFSATGGDYATPRLIDMAFYSFQLSDFVNIKMIPFIYGVDFLFGVVGAILVFRWRGQYRFWMVSSLIFLALTLGPYLKPFDIPLPYAAIKLWPAAMQFRTPYRFVMPALIGWAVTTGLFLANVFSRISGKVWSWGLVLLLVSGRLWYTTVVNPFETQVYPDYRFYHWVAKVPGDFTIMEIPFGVRTGLERIGNGGEAMQYYQHIHGKRILNASVPRLPRSIFVFYRSHPVLMFFAGEAEAKRDILEQDFAHTLVWSNTRYVVIHKSRLPQILADHITSFLNEQPQIEFLSAEDDLIVYQVRKYK